MMIGLDFPISAIRSQVASGLQIIVQLSRLSDGSRRIMSISEISGMEGDVITMQDIFVFQRSGIGENGEVLGKFVATGIRPKCAEQLERAGVHLQSDAFSAEGSGE